MKRRSPPWGAIEAFIVASRVDSFKEAASQLGLSPAALSRRVQTLEHHVGVKLFDRAASTPTLTSAGARYLTRLQPGYDAMRAATDWMAPNHRHRPLRVAVSQSFAISWLVPRLPRFYEQSEGIELILQTGNGHNDLMGGAADVRILYGAGDWHDFSVQKLFSLDAFVAAAPILADGRRPPRNVNELAEFRVLDLVHPANQWAEWLPLAGYEGALPRDIVTFDSAQVMYEAAAQGLGVVLGVRPLVDPFLADGRLAPAFKLAKPMSGAYYVAALPDMRRQEAVHIFWRWLCTEAASPDLGLWGESGLAAA